MRLSQNRQLWAEKELKIFTILELGCTKVLYHLLQERNNKTECMRNIKSIKMTKKFLKVRNFRT